MPPRAILGATLVALLIPLSVRSPAGEATSHGHTMLKAGDVQWGPPPPMLPAGAKTAVLYGDPTKPGMFILRAKMPAGYRIPAHSHPNDETVTVLSGSFKMGMGDKLDAAAATPLAAGAFAMMPAKANHFAMADSETVIQVVANGPLEFNYVDPKDDPRNAKGAAPADR